MAKQLTKQDLIKDFGVTNILEDGKIYIDGKEAKPYVVLGPVRKYSGNQKKYHMLTKYSNGKTITVLWHRAVYAWFNDVVPGNMDVDHVDRNPFNNALSNLQILTHRDNLANRGGFKNQYDAMKQDDRYRFKSLYIQNLKNEIKLAHKAVNRYKDLLKVCYQEWHDAPKGVKKILAHHNVELCKIDIENATKNWRALIKQLDYVTSNKLTVSQDKMDKSIMSVEINGNRETYVVDFDNNSMCFIPSEKDWDYASKYEEELIGSDVF